MENNSFIAKVLAFLAIFLFLGLSLQAFEIVDSDFGRYIGTSRSSITGVLLSATDTMPPKQYDDLVLFMMKPKVEARYIGIAFAHEDFNKIHLFAKQSRGIYYFLYKLTGEEEYLDYRLVVDGVWLADTSQKLGYNDSYGHQISRFIVQKNELEEKFGVIPLKDREFLFRYRGGAGNRVYLNSDMGSWDPFRYRMKEVNPGVYEIVVRMTPGEHYYYFIENGQKYLGQIASNVRIHRIEGDVNSLLVQ